MNQEDSTSQSDSNVSHSDVSDLDSDDSLKDKDYVLKRKSDGSSTTDYEISGKGCSGVTQRKKLKGKQNAHCKKRTTKSRNKTQMRSFPTNINDIVSDYDSDIVHDSECSPEDSDEISVLLPVFKENIDKRNRTYDRRNKNIYIRKVLETLTSTNGQRKKRSTVWNQVHACTFCKNVRTNIAKHLRKHSDQHEMTEILELSKKYGSKHKEVKARWDMLRNAGDNTNNKRVLNEGSGEVILGRRLKGTSFDINQYGPCPGCLVWIKSDKTMRFHQKHCPAVVLGLSDCQKKSTKELRILSLCESGKINSVASRGLREEVFTIMRNDDISTKAQTDPLIVSLGNMWLLKNIGNKLKRKYYTSQRMRDAARLLMNLQSQTCVIKPLFHFLTPLFFDDVIKASLTTASPDFDDEEDLKAPSTAIKLGYDIKRLTGAKWAMCLKLGEKEEVENCNDFLKLMQIEWSLRVAKIAHVTLETRRFNQVRTLPNPDDLVIVQNHIKGQLNALKPKDDPASFRRTVELCQSRLLLYNKRRSGEVDAMTLKQYVRRQIGVSDIERSMRAQLSDLELHLLKSQELMETRGKGGRGVPVIIPKDVQTALEHISNAHIRNNCGIHPDNLYLFPNTKMGAIRAYDSLKSMCQEVKLRQPEQITSVNLRKYTATVSQIYDLNHHQQQWLLNHLGHSLDVHKIHYRQTSGVIERVDIAKMMLLQEYNVAGKYAGKTLDSIDLTELVFPSSSEEQVLETCADVGENETASLESCVPNDGEVQPDLHNADTFDEYNFMDDDVEEEPKRKQKSVSRVPWTEEELSEINSYFERHLATGLTPGMRDCYKAIELSKKNNGKIHRRSWTTIKKKVWNYIHKKKNL